MGGEIFFGGVHGGDSPEGSVALVYEGVARDGDSVLEGEEFAVTHDAAPFFRVSFQGSVAVSSTGEVGRLSFPVVSSAVTR